MALDYAQQVELALLGHQKPMNDVIDRGDSDVQHFYRDTTVLVTGGSGFLGKQLVEKLFRSCDIKKVYLLIRPKKGIPIEERLNSILKDPLYEIVRKKKPYFVERIMPVEGDVGELRVGLSQKDWDTITKEVNIIIHMAATVNFDEPLHVAGMTNVRGTREMLELGKQCQHLKLFTYVSTAFAHATVKRINTDVKEQFYPSIVHPHVFLDMIACMDQDKINRIQPALIEDWPNTYTFTKALAEELVRISAGELPICIVKPPVVTNAFLEPSPGWIDHSAAMSSCMGFLLGAGLGVMHVLLVKKDVVVSYAPVDIVNNAVIAAGWDSVQHRQLWAGDIPIYTISNSNGSITWGMFCPIMQTDEFYRLSSPKTLWYSYLLETNSLLLFKLLSLFLHFIPGYILDALITVLGVRPKGVPSLVKVYNRVYNLTMVYNYFLTNTWNFRDDNLRAMMARLSPADSAIYNCDVTRITIKEFCQACWIGLRRFIIKDGLQGSDVGYRKQRWLYYANIVFMSLYIYCIWWLLAMVYATLAMLLSL